MPLRDPHSRSCVPFHEISDRQIRVSSHRKRGGICFPLRHLFLREREYHTGDNNVEMIRGDRALALGQHGFRDFRTLISCFSSSSIMTITLEWNIHIEPSRGIFKR
jgi:hypothetical protein